MQNEGSSETYQVYKCVQKHSTKVTWEVKKCSMTYMLGLEHSLIKAKDRKRKNLRFKPC